MPRKKSTTVDAPTTIEEATALLSLYAAHLTSIEKLKADADTSIAAIEGARDEFVKPLEEAMQDMFLRLRSWWAVAGGHITDGKKKSAEIAGLLLGIRTTTPALKLPKGMTVEQLVAKLEEFHLSQFVVVTKKADKQGLIKALGQPVGRLQETLICDVGVARSQREEFFIDRAAPKPADPEVVDATVEVRS